VNQNKRLLIERREKLKAENEAQKQLANAHKSGSIIDLEV